MFKHKDLIPIPWLVALALQADGWYLRSDIIWHKPNPMPESCTDRPTKSHEHVFLLTKQPRYFYDADAVRETAKYGYCPDEKAFASSIGESRTRGSSGWRSSQPETGRNLRDVWTIPTQACPEAHFATFPEKLVEPCIKAGTSEWGCCPKCGAGWKRVVESDRQPTRPGRNNVNDPTGMANRDPQRHVTMRNVIGWQPECVCGECADRDLGGKGCTNSPPEPIPCTVLDPFSGRGTTGIVAIRLGRQFIGIELSTEYEQLARTNLEAASTGLTPDEIRDGQSALFPDAGGLLDESC